MKNDFSVCSDGVWLILTYNFVKKNMQLDCENKSVQKYIFSFFSNLLNELEKDHSIQQNGIK